VGNGSQGNIHLDANVILLRQGSQISTNAIGSATGGNITIDSPIIVGLENSDIIANAKGGRGGNINIKTQDLIGLKFRNTLTPRTDLTNDITASSEFSINGNVSINTIGIDPNSGLVSLPVDLTDASRQISDRCAAAKTSSFISTGRGGIPNSPMRTRKSDRTWHDLRATESDRSASSSVITPIAQNPTALVEASAFKTNSDGSIELVAPMPSAIDSGATCALQ
jgi:large exoprotein involved in heme utilization and adhesion